MQTAGGEVLCGSSYRQGKGTTTWVKGVKLAAQLHIKRTAGSSPVAFSLTYLQCSAATPTHLAQIMQYVN